LEYNTKMRFTSGALGAAALLLITPAAVRGQAANLAKGDTITLVKNFACLTARMQRSAPTHVLVRGKVIESVASGENVLAGELNAILMPGIIDAAGTRC
jgi:hypothetical protein